MGNAIVVETALGACGFSWTSEGVRRFSLPQESQKALLRRVDAELSSDDAPGWAAELAGRVRRHLDGAVDDFCDVPIDFSGVSTFEAMVYRALREVRPGETTTYGALASAIGQPGAARALGRAMATNPIPLLVPCHRVLAAGGKVGGFSAYGGVVTKERLLAIEGVKRPRQGDLFA